MSNEESLLGALHQSFGKLKVGIDADPEPIKKITKAFSDLSKQLVEIKKELDAINKSAIPAASNLTKASKAGSSASGASGTTSAGTPMANIPSAPMGGGGGGGGGVPQLGMPPQGPGQVGTDLMSPGKFKMGTATTIAAAAMEKAMATIDARADRNRDYAISADRMSVLYQQMTGKSQLDVQATYRKPLTNYRLGEGGINALMGMQARTGISALQQASSVEAMRTYSGYSLSAGDATSMIENLASAPVANRMFMMMGGGLVGAGGKQRSMQQVMENIVKSAGLTNEKLVQSGMASGSLTRAKLTAMGVSADMQDTVLQYAQQNIQYKKKGGKGMYDASDKEARKLMGIEDNYATQAEETERVKIRREEQMYRRQADNYADLEKQTQSLTKAMGGLEDKLSGIIGARTSNRISSTIGGVLGGIAGFAIGGPGGAALGYMAGTTAGGLIGSPEENRAPGGSSSGGGASSSLSSANDSTITVPTYNGTKTLDQLKSHPSFSNLKSDFKERLLNMMRANPKIGFGQGTRDLQSQSTMFFDRYVKSNRPVTNPNDLKNDPNRLTENDRAFQGFWWDKKDGVLPAATPGNSLHGVGLAADLYFADTEARDWAYAHAAEFGLEGYGAGDWPHFSPVEFAHDTATSYYDKGAPWGSGPVTRAEIDAYINGTGTGGAATASGSTFTGTFAGPAGTPMSSGSVSSSGSGGAGASGGAGGAGGSSDYQTISQRVSAGIRSSGSSGSGKTSSGTRLIGAGGSAPAPGAMSGEEVARLIHGQGFTGDNLIKMLAIAYRESRWNPSSHNGDASSGDDSYGLFQMNTSGDMWEGFYVPRGLTDKKQLFDPSTNMRMAKALYDAGVAQHEGNGFYYWGDYPNSGPGSSDGGLDIPMATDVVASAGLGDPIGGNYMPSASRGSGSGFTTINGGHTFHVNPSITLVSSGNLNVDIHKVAQEVGRMIEEQIRMKALRTS